MADRATLHIRKNDIVKVMAGKEKGKIGRVHTVEMQVWTGGTVPHQKAEPVPSGWDYDQWLGPVQWRPFVPARAFNWTCFWDTGEGMHTDMGTHYTDQMQWVLGTDDTGPVEFEATDLVWPDPKQFMSETAISGTSPSTISREVPIPIEQFSAVAAFISPCRRFALRKGGPCRRSVPVMSR